MSVKMTIVEFRALQTQAAKMGVELVSEGPPAPADVLKVVDTAHTSLSKDQMSAVVKFAGGLAEGSEVSAPDLYHAVVGCNDRGVRGALTRFVDRNLGVLGLAHAGQKMGYSVYKKVGRLGHG